MPSDNKTIRKLWALADENRQLRAALHEVLGVLEQAMLKSTPAQVAEDVAHSVERIQEALTKP